MPPQEQGQTTEQPGETPAALPVHVRSFLIADIRGYTSFTRERGDEAAADLASAFAQLTREGVRSHAGEVIELRGDEALATFPSTRQALRAAVDLQLRYLRYSEEHPDRPLPVGIGLDAGEAVPVEGGYRGAALNMAARLCSAAGPSEILSTETVTHLAGAVAGLTYEPRRLKRLKGMTEPVRAMHVSSGELDRLRPSLPAPPSQPEPASIPFLDAMKGSEWGGFGQEVSSLVRQHLDDVNQEIKRELERELEEFRAPTSGRARPVTVPARGPVIDVSPVRTRARTWLVPVLALAVIVIAVIVLWAVFH